MTKRKDHFAATLVVTPGATVDFGFLTTRARNGVDVSVWEEGDGEDSFREKADLHHVIRVHPK